jgi:hypothetical protein
MKKSNIGILPYMVESNVLLAKNENEKSNIGNIITDFMTQYSMWNNTTIAFINYGIPEI